MSKSVQAEPVYARELSMTQASHLTGMIAIMNVAQGRLEATQRVTAEQVAVAQKEFDQARDSAQAFLNYCAAELGVTFTSGEWTFDQQQMAFVPAQVAMPTIEYPEMAETIHVNGQQI